MTDDELLALLRATADAVARALADLQDWGEAGTRAGQHHSDLLADAAALDALEDAGVGVLSEESGMHHPERPILVVVDPVDGSTNASRGIPWFATSLCALDGDGPRAALVVNLATGVRYEAIRGGGARRDGQPIRPSGCSELAHAVVGVSGPIRAPAGWKQYRALGAAALDLCAVASGQLDAYLDCSHDAHGPWDYLGALLVCAEAGAPIEDAFGRLLVATGHADRRTILAAATPTLLEELRKVRSAWAEQEPRSLDG